MISLPSSSWGQLLYFGVIYQIRTRFWGDVHSVVGLDIEGFVERVQVGDDAVDAVAAWPMRIVEQPPAQFGLAIQSSPDLSPTRELLIAGQAIIFSAGLPPSEFLYAA